MNVSLFGVDSVTFAVRSGSPTLLTLAPLQPSLTSYRVHLGVANNTGVTIDRGVTEVARCSDAPVLRPGAFRRFWLSWGGEGGGLLSVGRGPRVGQGVLLKWRDPNPLRVRTLAVGAEGAGTADWKFGELYNIYNNNCNNLFCTTIHGGTH